MVLEYSSVLNCLEFLCDAILISFARLSMYLAYRKDYALLLTNLPQAILYCIIN